MDSPWCISSLNCHQIFVVTLAVWYICEGSGLTFFIQILTSFYMKLMFALIFISLSLYKIKIFQKLNITAVSAEFWIYVPMLSGIESAKMSEELWTNLSRDNSHNPSLNLGSQLLHITSRVEGERKPRHICPLVKQLVLETRMSHFHMCFICMHFYEYKEVFSNFTLSLPCPFVRYQSS